MSDFILNEKQSYGMRRIAAGSNLFFTGSGGVGKSVLVHHIKDLYGDNTIFLSPTGIAALNIEGATIHSTFRFPLGLMTTARQNHVTTKVMDLFANDTIKRIVIDEISMVRADLLDAIDRNLRKAKKRNKPFGGLQIIVVGDFFQLPPVLQYGTTEANLYKEMYPSVYCFHSLAWQEAGFEMVELSKVMRQTDEVHIGMLQSIRKKTPEYEIAVDYMNRKCLNNSNVDEDAVMICTTNANADAVNQDHYDRIDSPEKKFFANYSPSCKVEPAPRELKLKIGCKVIMLVNNEMFMNGSIGFVVGFEGNKIMVQLEGNDKTPIPVERNTWKETDYEISPTGELTQKVIGEYTQYPMKLAWALTAHKCQGQSFEQGHIYFGKGCFAHGQAYVALSRFRYMDKMNLIIPINKRDIIVDPEVLKFYEDVKSASLLNF